MTLKNYYVYCFILQKEAPESTEAVNYADQKKSSKEK